MGIVSIGNYIMYIMGIVSIGNDKYWESYRLSIESNSNHIAGIVHFLYLCELLRRTKGIGSPVLETLHKKILKVRYKNFFD